MGGIEQVINQLAQATGKHGVEIDVLTLSAENIPQIIEMNGYSVHRAKKNFEIASTAFSVSVFSKFSKLTKKADIIHYHFPWPFMDFLHFAAKVRKKTVVTYHSDIIRQKKLLKIYRPLMYKFLGDVDHIVATSPNYLITSEVLAYYRKKVSVIPIGLDKNTYPLPSPEKMSHWRNKLPQKFFLFIGSLRYYKGLHILLEAARITKYPIVIVGAGFIERELRGKAAQLGLSDVFFLGQLPDEDKVALLKLCYCVVFPSHLRSEAFGITLLEGAMYEKPLISSEIGSGTTFVNIADKTGLVVRPGDPIHLSEAMRFVWENPECAARMGQSAVDRFNSYFTADRMAMSHINLYRDLINSCEYK